ncbi:hypothetical protein G7Y89_g985 [Cudoniella acicularis]|uniref:Uncharacterized protein n=1 Tax=Cudoniella acicularis TaxID=354080 RepID=A0A8H4RX62_9HELO|nr:hypothetical protein G7Y89_g985 [Cudoniella acicularis]
MSEDFHPLERQGCQRHRRSSHHPFNERHMQPCNECKTGRQQAEEAWADAQQAHANCLPYLALPPPTKAKGNSSLPTLHLSTSFEEFIYRQRDISRDPLMTEQEVPEHEVYSYIHFLRDQAHNYLGPSSGDPDWPTKLYQFGSTVEQMWSREMKKLRHISTLNFGQWLHEKRLRHHQYRNIKRRDFMKTRWNWNAMMHEYLAYLLLKSGKRELIGLPRRDKIYAGLLVATASQSSDEKRQGTTPPRDKEMEGSDDEHESDPAMKLSKYETLVKKNTEDLHIEMHREIEEKANLHTDMTPPDSICSAVIALYIRQVYEQMRREELRNNGPITNNSSEARRIKRHQLLIRDWLNLYYEMVQSHDGYANFLSDTLTDLEVMVERRERVEIKICVREEDIVYASRMEGLMREFLGKYGKLYQDNKEIIEIRMSTSYQCYSGILFMSFTSWVYITARYWAPGNDALVGFLRD